MRHSVTLALPATLVASIFLQPEYLVKLGPGALDAPKGKGVVSVEVVLQNEASSFGIETFFSFSMRLQCPKTFFHLLSVRFVTFRTLEVSQMSAEL